MGTRLINAHVCMGMTACAFHSYLWACTAGTHATNDGTSQCQNGTKSCDNHHGHKAAFNGLDVTAVVNCWYKMIEEERIHTNQQRYLTKGVNNNKLYLSVKFCIARALLLETLLIEINSV